jgi:hypothetical protein
MRLNNLYPRIKKAITDGTFLQDTLLQDLIYNPIDLLWQEQNAQILGDK